MARILIIDDETKLRETICEMLSFVGYDVYQAENGSEGLEKVNKLQPDLIICDIMMPILDGYGFIKQHQLSNYSNIPVLFLTAKVELKDIENAIKIGVKGYIKKPFLFSELKQQIEFYLLPEN
ncbi:response regulator [Flavobacterium sp. GB2R13]|uniref:response regulator n=1 Tax=Flavobacterium algoris TaxID=3398733 RepID=UPI003A8B8DC9